ncbi:MAG: methylenetetrahydrofolate reductase [Thermoplasmata archaeon]|nr:methylenetetrahydrofolate reductase [Thermoplasmata archaeon]
MGIEFLRDIIKKNKFPITFEPDSPKGISIEEKFPKKIIRKISAFGVYNNPRGRPKLDPFVYGWMLKEKYKKDVIVNVRIQDYSIPLFQSILWGGHLLGLRNLLIITGDYYPGSPFLIDVTEGLTAVKDYLNNGYIIPELNGKARRYYNRLKEKKYIKRENKVIDGKTDYFVGAALIPTRKKEIEIYKKKIDAGAQFFITQLTYDSKTVTDFIEKVDPSVPILVGSGPITSLKRLEFFKKQLGIPGLSDGIARILREAKDIGEKSVEICVEMYQNLRDFAKSNGYTIGAHVMSIKYPSLAAKIIEEIAKL